MIHNCFTILGAAVTGWLFIECVWFVRRLAIAILADTAKSREDSNARSRTKSTRIHHNRFTYWRDDPADDRLHPRGEREDWN